uniref:Transmembrane protein 168 n=1 Tax=Plectus sambesii TaxID=2011161 RepID=A0A914V3X1_9BILA
MLTTGILGVLCWTTRTTYNFSLLSIVLALEAMVAELLSEFSRSLGGTCVGSGIVAPVVALRNDGSVTVLPPNFIQEAGARSTRTLRAVVDFFSEHMITNCGCDWSMAGVSLDDVEKKLTNFFQQTTAEGPRFDTYFFYYSGPTTPTGDWALTNGGTLSLDRLLSIWRENNPDRGASRLVLMCDCEHASQWAASVRQLGGGESFVALQTLQLSKSRRDPESPPAIGDFTDAWT